MKVSVVLKCVNKAKLVNVADMHVHGDLVADIVYTLSLYAGLAGGQSVVRGSVGKGGWVVWR